MARGQRAPVPVSPDTPLGPGLSPANQGDARVKRRQPRKLRDRRTGQSPYQKYHKAPYLYSGAYYSWRSRFKKTAPSTREAA